MARRDTICSNVNPFAAEADAAKIKRAKCELRGARMVSAGWGRGGVRLGGGEVMRGGGMQVMHALGEDGCDDDDDDAKKMKKKSSSARRIVV